MVADERRKGRAHRTISPIQKAYSAPDAALDPNPPHGFVHLTIKMANFSKALAEIVFELPRRAIGIRILTMRVCFMASIVTTPFVK
jgi:hypothetical protein